ncbi:hypothetical protein [Kribbella sp. CA-293567]|uniref:hypothetical protein n=1 Tax=Kribbella sp. CA-293567 TaxID=3002436 RepID=UPI0022DD16DD|nr:hypothetical protein [Kribbella sp. CA-293567]WBQ05313.1 hypothetical protein OX958_00605 [Kribbella sp. CA-293567]
MNEQDLRERLELSVGTDLGDPVVDPAADISRGRKRLRRIRLASGLAAATSVAAVAALGVQFLPADDQLPVPAAKPTAVPKSEEAGQDWQADLAAAVYRNVDPKRAHLTKESGWTFVHQTGRKKNPVQEAVLGQVWQQGGGTGRLLVSVSAPDRAQAEATWCDPEYDKDHIKATCSAGRTAGGAPIVSGPLGQVVNSKGVAYPDSGGTFVRYVRPDGQVVVVAISRLNTFKRVADDLPAAAEPAVTLEQLYALATDPALSITDK